MHGGGPEGDLFTVRLTYPMADHHVMISIPGSAAIHQGERAQSNRGSRAMAGLTHRSVLLTLDEWPEPGILDLGLGYSTDMSQ